MPKRESTPPLARFWDKFQVNFETGCWEWKASQNGVGYGVISVDRYGRKALAHRVSYEYHHGPIPEGLVIDHLCRNPGCVNPRHLEAVTQRENSLRGTSPAARQAAQTHCKHGHEFTPENTMWRQNHRTCRACHRRTQRERYWRLKSKREEAAA